MTMCKYCNKDIKCTECGADLSFEEYVNMAEGIWAKFHTEGNCMHKWMRENSR